MGVSVGIPDGARGAVLLSSSGPSTGGAEPVSEPTVEAGAILTPVGAMGVSLGSTAIPKVSREAEGSVTESPEICGERGSGVTGARGEGGRSLFPSESGSAPGMTLLCRRTLTLRRLVSVGFLCAPCMLCEDGAE